MARALDRYLEQLLQVYWLRPETALWRAFDCALMDRHAPRGRTLDLGCGDGILSYIMAGGRLAGHDAFLEVGGLDRFNKGADIYNVRASRRRFNADSSGLRYTFTLGVDHKDGLLSKARRLPGFYKETLRHDLDKRLPLEDGSFDAAFSNILYWLKDVDASLADWSRVLRRAGSLYVFVPNENFKDKAWLYYRAPHKGELRYFNFFNRGYSGLMHHCYDDAGWRRRFARNGFVVSEHAAYLTDPVMAIWNVGTRPISPLLIEMANSLTPAKRSALQRRFVGYFADFMGPILRGEHGRKAPAGKCAFHFYALKKR